MTPTEFRAWFDGFTEALPGSPTKAQWARIKERVAEIDGKTVTQQVFVDRYSQYPYWTGWGHLIPPCGSVSGENTTGTDTTAYQNAIGAANSCGFNSANAMLALALGRADAQSLAS